jgi:hypothetical protein
MPENKYFLIAGPARTGKSIIRKRLLEKYSINGFCTDSLVSMLLYSSPELGISYQESDYSHITKYIQGLLTYQNNVSTIFEGVGIYASDWLKYKDFGNVEMVGIGNSEISVLEKMNQIRLNPTYNDWTSSLSDQDLYDLCVNLIDQSLETRESCLNYNLPYFDLSTDFEEAIEEIVDYIYSRI